jgi:hypothetical protein
MPFQRDVANRANAAINPGFRHLGGVTHQRWPIAGTDFPSQWKSGRTSPPRLPHHEPF